MIYGLLGAFGAAVLYGVATTLQAVGVRRATAAAPGLWAKVWTARLYVVGLALDGLGFLASLAALRTLPLFVVESAIASSVAVTALLAVVFLGARLSPKELLGLVAVGAGLAALALSAHPGGVPGLRGEAPWLLLGLTVPVSLLGVVAASSPPARGAPLLAVVSGLGFGGTGVAARVLVLPGELWQVLLDPVFWAVLAYALVGLVAYGLALQRGSVTMTAAVAFSVETVVPAAIGLLWLGDSVRAGAQALAAAGFALTLAGCILLARHATEEPVVPPRDEVG